MMIYHHRVDLISALLKKGYLVSVLAPDGKDSRRLREIGCEIFNLDIENRGTNIFNDAMLLKGMLRYVRKISPDIILTFYSKTNIYGGLVARFLKIPYIVNVTGLGSSLVAEGILASFMRRLYKNAVKDASLLFFQNQCNYDFFVDHKIYNGSFEMLPGSGVNLDYFSLLPYPEGNPVNFMFISRLLKEKGIEDYIEAAAIVKERYPESVFNVVGPFENELQQLIDEAGRRGVIRYHGSVDDSHEILESIHCTVLPSYYPEGMANVLLESAASGRPVITTDRPGCRETVEDGVTGFLVPPRQSRVLAETMMRFIELPFEKKQLMGIKGRKKMEREFDRRVVTNAYLKALSSILK